MFSFLSNVQTLKNMNRFILFYFIKGYPHFVLTIMDKKPLIVFSALSLALLDPLVGTRSVFE